MYTVEERNTFLDQTFGTPVKVFEYFPDAEKCIRSVSSLQKEVGTDGLDKKHFRLKKVLDRFEEANKGEMLKEVENL